MTAFRIVSAPQTAGTVAMSGSGREFTLLLVIGRTFAPLGDAWKN